MSTKLWYSTIGHLATRLQSPFSGVARTCAHAPIIFTAVSKREAVRLDAMFLLTKVMNSIVPSLLVYVKVDRVTLNDHLLYCLCFLVAK